jgi:hypothetical protein
MLTVSLFSTILFGHGLLTLLPNSIKGGSYMQTIRNMVCALVIAAFAVVTPIGHTAEAKTHHKKHVTMHHVVKHHAVKKAKTIHSTALRSGTMIVPASARSTRTLHATTTGYVPSTNPYDNDHANLINKAKEKWANAKHKVKYDTYRLSHGGTTSAEEQRQDAAREAQDRAHEAQDRAKMGSTR